MDLEDLWSDEEDESQKVQSWPDSTIVCNCLYLTKGKLMEVIEQQEITDVETLAQSTRASTICGSCKPLLGQLLGVKVQAEEPVIDRHLLWPSIVAITLVGFISFFFPVSFAKSVQSFWYKIDVVFRDNFMKQISGFTLLGLSSIALLLSARRRLDWFMSIDFVVWRRFHAILSLFILAALIVHTGLYFGKNLNFALMMVFVLLNLSGGVTGVFAAIEGRGRASIYQIARRLRPYTTIGHITLFLFLPILLLYHVLAVYYY